MAFQYTDKKSNRNLTNIINCTRQAVPVCSQRTLHLAPTPFKDRFPPSEQHTNYHYVVSWVERVYQICFQNTNLIYLNYNTFPVKIIYEAIYSHTYRSRRLPNTQPLNLNEENYKFFGSAILCKPDPEF
jgi:hypothetical protein